MSRTSGFELWTIVYSKGRKKSFWNLKCGNSSFSKNLMASWRSASKAKNATWGLLWQQTCTTKSFKELLPHYERHSLG